ncbi:hypothetical protein RAA17_19630 [Komagataeibacter rhaeticus]|nr:hypothetical protein [Komagataeibacter rhaeticus]
MSATARASFGIYTTPEEIATLAATLEQIRGFLSDDVMAQDDLYRSVSTGAGKSPAMRATCLMRRCMVRAATRFVVTG